MEGSGHGLIYDSLSHDSRSSGQDSNPGPPRYDTGLLTTRPRQSVTAVRRKKAPLDLSLFSA
jgi:hypothetical protein